MPMSKKVIHEARIFTFKYNDRWPYDIRYLVESFDDQNNDVEVIKCYLLVYCQRLGSKL